MINADEVAVCVVGLAGPGYEKVLDIAKKVSAKISELPKSYAHIMPKVKVEN